MNTYYEVVGMIDGMPEVLYGSFVRSDCLYELESERGWWYEEGYRALTVEARWTMDSPDPEVYTAEELEEM